MRNQNVLIRSRSICSNLKIPSFVLRGHDIQKAIIEDRRHFFINLHHVRMMHTFNRVYRLLALACLFLVTSSASAFKSPASRQQFSTMTVRQRNQQQESSTMTPTVQESSKSTSAALKIRGGGNLDTNVLVNVFKVHRFLAAGLALFCIAAPGATAFGAIVMTETESKLLQSWGGFIGFVAFCVHSAIKFPAAVQLKLGKGLLGLFAFEFLLYLQIIFGMDSDVDPKERDAVTVYLGVFATVMSAYAVGVFKALQ